VKLFGRLCVSWLHSCSVCQPLKSRLSLQNDELAAKEAALEQVSCELDQLRAQEETTRGNDRASGRVHAELDRVTGQLCSLTGQRSLGEALGVVHAWHAWSQRGPELERDNATLRLQLHSVALRGMHTVDMLREPVCDPPKPTGKEN
jgi:hypothetical protein